MLTPLCALCADIAAVVALHALSEDAKRCYESRGFLASPVRPMTMCLMLETARKALAEG
ncbi:MAG TPA: hypothetical protein PLQ67_08765 [Burkholderiaceae bacterium]|nr:hypothetical protein [Burkholderiaceae bacterium]